jgi:hypothetical protein
MNTPIQTSVRRVRKHVLAKFSRSFAPAMSLFAVALVCFELLPTAYAVRPTPSPSPTPSPTATPTPTPSGEDRGNGNSAAESVDALNISTTGLNNTAHGWHALSVNTEGSQNTATGYSALFSNITGSHNTAYGDQALLSNTAGFDNTAVGRLALAANTTGVYNTATGSNALSNNTNASYNTAHGAYTLQSNTTGQYNTAVGYAALYNADAAYNTAIGSSALGYNTTGSENTATGGIALYSNTTGSHNTAIGTFALESNTTGHDNVALGYGSGYNQTVGSRNTYIGFNMFGVSGENDSCYIGSIFGQTSSGGTPVYINSAGKLGTTTSSRRFKEDIKPMNDASEALFALKPVTFRYKKEIDSQGIPQFGLIAEDVAEVNPQLVVRDKEGKVNTVRYEQINAMLLNEFLKEHKKVEEQQVTISDLKKDLGVLTAQLKEQAAAIQKVSAQVEMRRPLTRVARSYP